MSTNAPMRDTLTHILAQVGRNSHIVSPDEANDLFRRARSGDNAAGDRLFWSVAKLAVKWCRKYSRTRQHFEELLNPAFEGILRGIYKSPYDPDRGVRFATYIVFYIRAGILQHIERNRRTVSIANNEYWRMVRDDELPGQVPIEGLSEEDNAGALRRDHSDFDAVDDADEIAHKMQRVENALALLSERGRSVLHEYYAHEKTLAKIGDEIGVGKERVRQIRVEAEEVVKRAIRRGVA